MIEANGRNVVVEVCMLQTRGSRGCAASAFSEELSCCQDARDVIEAESRGKTPSANPSVLDTRVTHRRKEQGFRSVFI